MKHLKATSHQYARLTIPWLVGALFSAHALGYQTELDDGTQVISTTNISYGAQQRADRLVPILYRDSLLEKGQCFRCFSGHPFIVRRAGDMNPRQSSLTRSRPCSSPPILGMRL